MIYLGNGIYSDSGPEVLAHGREWKAHKYIAIKNGRYIYPEDVKKSSDGGNGDDNKKNPPSPGKAVNVLVGAHKLAVPAASGFGAEQMAWRIDDEIYNRKRIRKAVSDSASTLSNKKSNIKTLAGRGADLMESTARVNIQNHMNDKKKINEMSKNLTDSLASKPKRTVKLAPGRPGADRREDRNLKNKTDKLAKAGAKVFKSEMDKAFANKRSKDASATKEYLLKKKKAIAKGTNTMAEQAEKVKNKKTYEKSVERYKTKKRLIESNKPHNWNR